jgi:hypothetical protein
MTTESLMERTEISKGMRSARMISGSLLGLRAELGARGLDTLFGSSRLLPYVNLEFGHLGTEHVLHLTQSAAAPGLSNDSAKQLNNQNRLQARSAGPSPSPSSGSFGTGTGYDVGKPRFPAVPHWREDMGAATRLLC